MALLRKIGIVASAAALASVGSRADFDAAEITISLAAGPNQTDHWGSRARFIFDSAELHGSYERQTSKTDPSQGPDLSENGAGGFSQNLTDDLSVGLDYDHLNDHSQLLITDGVRLNAVYGILELSFRRARNELHQPFVPAGSVKTVGGAFTYQSTYGARVDWELTKEDSLSPTVSYSIFSPDVEKFSTLLSRPRVQAQTGFSSSLESYEQYSFGLDYRHEFGPRWDAELDLTYAHLIVGKNPLIVVAPSTLHRWADRFSTRMNFTYNYEPGSTSWTVGLDAIIHFGDVASIGKGLPPTDAESAKIEAKSEADGKPSP